MRTVKRDTGLLFEKEADRVRPNRLVLAAVTGVVWAVGVLPYAIYVGQYGAAILLAVLGVGFGVAAPGLRRFRSYSTEKPSLGEYLLGSWAAVMAPSTTSLMAMLAHWGTKKVIQLVRSIVAWAGGSFEPSADSWAFWISLGFVALIVTPGARHAADELATKLYPDTAGTRSSFYSLLVEKRRLTILLAISIAALVLIFLLLEPSGRGFAFVLALYLLYTGAALENIGAGAVKAPGKQRILDCLGKLCTAAGYQPTLSPRTGRSDIDPLIATVDLLALSPKRALAIEVKSGAHKSKPVEWFEASRLQTAAWALGRFLSEHELACEARPLLVLVGRAKAEGLADYLARSPLPMLEVDDSKLFDEILAEPDTERLRQIALDRFGIEAVAGYVDEPEEPGGEARQ